MSISRCLALIIALVCFQSASRSQWIDTEFPQGTASCIVAKEGNLFAGTWGNGVYRSTDGGGHWEAVNNGFASAFYCGYVYALAVVPASSGNGSYLFAGVEEGGIWRSTDDGDNWEWVYPLGVMGEHDISIYRFGVAGHTILAGVRQQGGVNGIYRSVDDGGSWTPSSGGFATEADSNIASFASITSGGTTYMYAGTDGGVFRSQSGGVGWTRISTGLPAGKHIQSLIALPASAGPGIILFAGAWDSGVYKSTDNGSSWFLSSNGFAWGGSSFGPTLYVDAFAASPVPGGTESVIFAAAHPSVYVSTNFGSDWESTQWPMHEATSPTCLSINGGALYASGMGVWKYSMEIDTTWSLQLSGTKDTLLAVKAVDNNVVWAGGTSGGVFRTTNGGALWGAVGSGAIGSDIVYVVEAIDAATAFASTTVFNGTTTVTKIFKTTNGGGSWSPAFSQNGGAILGIQMQSALQGYAVGNPVGGKWTILKTTDGGTGWNRIPTEPAQVGDESGSLAMQVLGNTIWFGTSSGSIYRSTDLGATWGWTNVSGSSVSGLKFNSPSTGMIGFDAGSSSYTTDGGASWDTAGKPGYNRVTSVSGCGTEYWAIAGSGIAYTKTLGEIWSFATPGHWGLAPLKAVSMTPAGSQINGWAVGESGIILHYRRQAAAIRASGGNVPQRVFLEQNFPNPFNPATTIRYELPRRSSVTLTVYNALGQVVATPVHAVEEAGSHQFRFDGARLASGVYMYRLQADDFVQVRKLVLLR